MTQDPDWNDLFSQTPLKEPLAQALSFVARERAAGKVIYPQAPDVFNAFNHTPFQAVKVVLLGQDPYHGQGQAHGLCFSVHKGIRLPPSLKNIFKELQEDIDIKIKSPSQNGDLTSWAQQGVLLLNTVLTVEAGQPFSHANQGWEEFTDGIIELLNTQKQGLIFLLWGAHAQKKAARVDTARHHILKAPHPSPFSARRGFFGCQHFSKTNALLKTMRKDEIEWEVT